MTKKGQINQLKKFGNEYFMVRTVHLTKKRAKESAKYFRSEGHKARVVIGYGKSGRFVWRVYID